APDGAPPARPAARRARSERGQHPARNSDRGAEPPPPRGGGATMSAAVPRYLDYAATTPVDPAVAAAMSGCLTAGGDFANPSSTHAPGMRAAARIEAARAQVAALIGAAPDEIVFTSGATESDNLGVLGVARANADRGRHVVSARTEHKAVLDPCKRLEKEGFSVTYLSPSRSGAIEPEAFAAALRPEGGRRALRAARREGPAAAAPLRWRAGALAPAGDARDPPDRGLRRRLRDRRARASSGSPPADGAARAAMAVALGARRGAPERRRGAARAGHPQCLLRGSGGGEPGERPHGAGRLDRRRLQFGHARSLLRAARPRARHPARTELAPLQPRALQHRVRRRVRRGGGAGRGEAAARPVTGRGRGRAGLRRLAGGWRRDPREGRGRRAGTGDLGAISPGGGR